MEPIAWFILYSTFSVLFAVIIYPFSRKWSRGAMKFVGQTQVSSAYATSLEYLVQTHGNKIIPVVQNRKPFFILIMFNLFVVSLVLGMLPDATAVKCNDGTIIEESWVNDGVADCSDSSDEYIEQVFGTQTGEPLQQINIDFMDNVGWILGAWGILLALCGPIFLIFLNTRLVYEYCPVLILDSKQQSINRFGEMKNRRLGPMLGSGAIFLTLQLIIREGWGKSSYSEMGSVLFTILVLTFAISIGQLITLMFSIKRVKKEASELALILLGFRLARPVTIYWNSTDRAVKQRLLEYRELPINAIYLDEGLLDKYDLRKEYDEQRKWIDEQKKKGDSAEKALTLMGIS